MTGKAKKKSTNTGKRKASSSRNPRSETDTDDYLRRNGAARVEETTLDEGTGNNGKRRNGLNKGGGASKTSGKKMSLKMKVSAVEEDEDWELGDADEESSGSEMFEEEEVEVARNGGDKDDGEEDAGEENEVREEDAEDEEDPDGGSEVDGEDQEVNTVDSEHEVPFEAFVQHGITDEKLFSFELASQDCSATMIRSDAQRFYGMYMFSDACIQFGGKVLFETMGITGKEVLWLNETIFVHNVLHTGRIHDSLHKEITEERWEQIFDSSFLFVPCFEQNHWSLLLLKDLHKFRDSCKSVLRGKWPKVQTKRKEKVTKENVGIRLESSLLPCALHFDSLPGGHSSCVRKILIWIRHGMERVWDRWAARYQIADHGPYNAHRMARTFNVNSLTWVEPECIEQHDDKSCGWLTLVHAQHCLRVYNLEEENRAGHPGALAEVDRDFKCHPNMPLARTMQQKLREKNGVPDSTIPSLLYKFSRVLDSIVAGYFSCKVREVPSKFEHFYTSTKGQANELKRKRDKIIGEWRDRALNDIRQCDLDCFYVNGKKKKLGTDALKDYLNILLQIPRGRPYRKALFGLLSRYPDSLLVNCGVGLVCYPRKHVLPNGVSFHHRKVRSADSALYVFTCKRLKGSTKGAWREFTWPARFRMQEMSWHFQAVAEQILIATCYQLTKRNGVQRNQPSQVEAIDVEAPVSRRNLFQAIAVPEDPKTGAFRLRDKDECSSLGAAIERCLIVAEDIGNRAVIDSAAEILRVVKGKARNGSCASRYVNPGGDTSVGFRVDASHFCRMPIMVMDKFKEYLLKEVKGRWGLELERSSWSQEGFERDIAKILQRVDDCFEVDGRKYLELQAESQAGGVISAGDVAEFLQGKKRVDAATGGEGGAGAAGVSARKNNADAAVDGENVVNNISNPPEASGDNVRFEEGARAAKSTAPLFWCTLGSELMGISGETIHHSTTEMLTFLFSLLPGGLGHRRMEVCGRASTFDNPSMHDQSVGDDRKRVQGVQMSCLDTQNRYLWTDKTSYAATDIYQLISRWKFNACMQALQRLVDCPQCMCQVVPGSTYGRTPLRGEGGLEYVAQDAMQRKSIVGHWRARVEKMTLEKVSDKSMRLRRWEESGDNGEQDVPDACIGPFYVSSRNLPRLFWMTIEFSVESDIELDPNVLPSRGQTIGFQRYDALALSFALENGKKAPLGSLSHPTATDFFESFVGVVITRPVATPRQGSSGYTLLRNGTRLLMHGSMKLIVQDTLVSNWGDQFSLESLCKRVGSGTDKSNEVFLMPFENCSFRDEVLQYAGCEQATTVPKHLLYAMWDVRAAETYEAARRRMNIACARTLYPSPGRLAALDGHEREEQLSLNKAVMHIDPLLNEEQLRVICAVLYGRRMTYTPNGVLTLDCNDLRFRQQLENSELSLKDLKWWGSTVTFLRGPPGTGKTRVIRDLIFSALKLVAKDMRILVISPTNEAVDHILSQVFKMDKEKAFRLVRVGTGSDSELGKALEAGAQAKESLPEKEYMHVVREAMVKVVEKARVVFTTYGSLVREELMTAKRPFDLVVEEEVGKTPDGLALAGAAVGFQGLRDAQNLFQQASILFVGDEKQLGAFSTVPEFLNPRRVGHFFSRAMRGGIDNDSVIRFGLKRQYRFNPAICDVVSKMFYDGELRTPLEEVREGSPGFVWTEKDELRNLSKSPFPVCRVSVIDTSIERATAHEKAGAGGRPGYYNEFEAEVIVNMLHAWKQQTSLTFLSKNVVVLTPYNRQRQCIVEKLERAGLRGVNVKTVDSMQGKEMNIVILSLVRSRSPDTRLAGMVQLGFVKEPERINVALTRARQRLIVLGNCELLSSLSDYWAYFFQFTAVKSRNGETSEDYGYFRLRYVQMANMGIERFEPPYALGTQLEFLDNGPMNSQR